MPEIKHLIVGCLGQGLEFYMSYLKEIQEFYGQTETLLAEVFLVRNCGSLLNCVLKEDLF